MTRAASSIRSFLSFVIRVVAAHVVTYWIVGGVWYWLVTHRYYVGASAIPGLRDPQSDFVMRWILPAQVLRGILYAAALYPVRKAFVDLGRWGGAAIALVLLLVGSVAGISGLIEGWVFTTNSHPEVWLATLPEIVAQTLLFGYLVVYWGRKALATAPAHP